MFAVSTDICIEAALGHSVSQRIEQLRIAAFHENVECTLNDFLMPLGGCSRTAGGAVHV